MRARDKYVTIPLVLVTLFSLLFTGPALDADRSAPQPMPLSPRLLAKWRREGRPLPPFVTDPRFFAERGINQPVVHSPHLAGEVRALAVVVEFTDHAGTVTPTFFDSLIFDLPVPGRGSVRDYYADVSYGQIDVVTVDMPSSLGWITATETYAYYVDGQTCFGGYPRNCQKLAEDIVDIINPLVDYSNYDSNGDGIMDPIMIIHAGRGYEDSGDPNDIWSHSWSLLFPRYYDGVTIQDYVTMPEYQQTVDPGYSDQTIGVFCHEMGHGFFGWPDLYDYDYSSWGVGYWSLMGYGGYSGPGGDGSSPAWPDAWSRIYAGFDTPTTIGDPTVANFAPVENGPGSILLLESSTLGAQEYFLVENRQRIVGSYDEYNPGSGLLIWHLDDSLMGYGPNSNECRSIPHCSGSCASTHYMVALEQADGADHLEYRSNGGDPADPFPGTGNRTFWQPYRDHQGVNPESGTWFDYGCSTDSCIDLTDIACATLGDCTAYVRRAGCQQQEADLGDAPAGENNHDEPMTAYPVSGPLPQVPALFPTVYLPLSTAPGPRHNYAQDDCWLGSAVSGEWNADLLPDSDGVTNIIPSSDSADLDSDDGLALPLRLAPCQESTLAYTVTLDPSAPLTLTRYANIWVDWNRDGDWGDTVSCPGGVDAPEWGWQDQVLELGLGSTPLTASLIPAITVAQDAPLQAWLRLSVAEQPAPVSGDGRGPDGGYQYGETEDYLLSLMPELAMEPAAPDPAPGSLYTYTIQYDGTGNVQAAGVIISDVLPLELDYVSSDPPGSYDPATRVISWTSDLVPGQPALITVVVQVNAGQGTRIDNGVALLWGNAPWLDAAMSFTVTCSPSDPQAAFEWNGPTCAGAPVSFTNLSTGTLPISFTWDLDGDGLPDSTAVEPTWIYTEAGRYTVTLAALNECGLDTISDVVTVTFPVSSVAVAGPSSRRVGEAGVYTATALPPEAAPILSWSNGTGGITATYSWGAPGLYTISVGAGNECGVITASMIVTVSECVALDGVGISGPLTLTVGETGLYGAVPEPLTATSPAYSWSNGQLGTTAGYSWTIAGMYSVTVTGTNCMDRLVTESISVRVWQEFRIYLPMVLKKG